MLAGVLVWHPGMCVTKDFIGRISRVNRKTSPVAASLQTLQRYMIAAHEVCHGRKGNEKRSAGATSCSLDFGDSNGLFVLDTPLQTVYAV